MYQIYVYPFIVSFEIRDISQALSRFIWVMQLHGLS